MEHHYKVEENKPYGTWAVVELWNGGLVRSPYKTKEEAVKCELAIRDYFDDLELVEAETAA